MHLTIPSTAMVIDRLDARWFGEYDSRRFNKLVVAAVDRESTVLEIGAGGGQIDAGTFRLRGRCARYVGIDVDRRVLEHPVSTMPRWRLPSGFRSQTRVST